jgi:uncharacterized membrane protein
MNTIRNILILIAVVVIAIMAVQFLSNIVPILVTAIAAFILGRLSVHFDLIGLIRARTAAPAQAAASAGETLKVTHVEAAKPAQTAAPRPAPTERLADEPAQKTALLDEDFEIKTPEQIEAEARRREQELSQKAATPNPDAVQAALEERRKRLLGDKGE